MSEDRTTRVWLSILECARLDAGPVALRHVCLACARDVAVDGAAVVLGTTLDGRMAEFATDVVAEGLTDAEAVCGEGPAMDALAQLTPVLVDDLGSAAAARRWPAYTAEAVRLGARAVFALPLRAGAACLGVLDLYRRAPGGLLATELADALAYTDAALSVALDDRAALLGGQHTPENDDRYRRGEDGRPISGAHIHQAAGMVSVQLGVSISDGMARLRAYAYAHGRGLDEVARAVVERQLRFTPMKPDSDEWRAREQQ